MFYLIDDLKVAALLRQLRPEYTEVRAVSEAQQFLAREGKAQYPARIEPPKLDHTAMREAMREEAIRLDMCEHLWEPQRGHRHSVCARCGSIQFGD